MPNLWRLTNWNLFGSICVTCFCPNYCGVLPQPCAVACLISEETTPSKPMKLSGLHHVAIICSDYEVSKRFYTEILGFELTSEIYRAEKVSYKADLMLNGHYIIELFSFPDPPARISDPEACGLRHIAFSIHDIKSFIAYLKTINIEVEDVRVDQHTGKQFTFFRDPDGLPIELYEE